MDDINPLTSLAAPMPTPEMPHRPLGLWAFLKAMRTNPLTAFPYAAYEEPHFRLSGSHFAPDFLIVSDPALVERVLVRDAAAFDKGDVVRRRMQPMIGDSILIAEAASWRPQRKLVAPLFRPDRVQAMMHQMIEAIDAVIGAVPKGRTDLGALMSQLAYRVISHTAFSDDGVSDAQAFFRAIEQYFATQGRLDWASSLGLPAWIPTRGRLQARTPLKLFRQEIGALIARRRARGADENGDLLDGLIAASQRDDAPLSADALYDNALTFLAAGHETTASAMTWTLYLLDRAPEWRARCQEEADRLWQTADMGDLGERDLESLTTLKACLNEAMRLYPPVPFIPRTANRSGRLGEITLKRGDMVFTSPWITHRHARIWDEPNTFMPERFLTNNSDKRRADFFPFGLGPRVCLGKGFALQEMLLALSLFLSRYRFGVVDSDTVLPIAAITLKPISPIIAEISQR